MHFCIQFRIDISRYNIYDVNLNIYFTQRSYDETKGITNDGSVCHDYHNMRTAIISYQSVFMPTVANVSMW